MKFTLPAACAALLLLAACSSSEPDTPPVVDPPMAQEPSAWVLSQGNQASNIPASMTHVSADGMNVTQDCFLDANGKLLGNEATCTHLYGSKLYISARTSDIVWVVDPRSLKAMEAIQPSATMQGHNPGDMASHDGKVYVSMFTGYVACIDTLSLAIEKEIQTGPNPEGLAVCNDALYVANSDGMNWTNNYADCSLSIIQLKSWTENKIQDPSLFLNPKYVKSNGRDVFVLCMGDYYTVPATVYKIGPLQSGVGTDDIRVIGPGTMMAIDGNDLYVVNDPMNMEAEMTFCRYNTGSGQLAGNFITPSAGTDSQVENPTCIAVNPYDGTIAVGSNYMGTQWALYDQPGYANFYAADGTFKYRAATGVGPVSITFVP